VITGVFAFIITASALWNTGYFVHSENTDMQLGDETLPGWQKISIDGNVTFDIPPGITQIKSEPKHIYRHFRNGSMEVVISYHSNLAGITCIIHNDEQSVKNRVSRIKVAGRDATLEYLGLVTFDLYQMEPVLKGRAICVPDINDGWHDLEILAKYKSDADRQTIERIIDSIKLP
jgi:hypothetical protein